MNSRRPRVRGIDEELWFGTYSDAEAEKKAAESVAATVGRVVGAKPFPVAAQRLADATRDPDCSLVQVVRILERDMALSARVLRLVNSASFALRTPCTSVRHAASLVGTQKLNQLATTAAILDMVDQSSVHASRILEHSAVVGGLCRYLGVHLGLPADELFTCGFLHDIGKLMLLEVEGKRYSELLTEVGPEYDAIHLYEREIFGFDHALLAGHVLSRWSIPDPVPKVVAWHHHVTRAYEEGPRWASMTSVLRLADLLSYALASDDDEAQVERTARSESASYLDISAAQLAAIWDELRSLHERSRALFRGEEPPQALPQVSLRPAARIGRPSASKGLRASHPSLRPVSIQHGPLGVPSSREGRALKVAAPVTVTIQEAPEGPKQFPCVVCGGPSFANACLACHGYVCPDHQRGPDDWCQLCRSDYVTESRGIRLRPILILLLGAGLGATIVGASVNVASGHGIGSVGMLVGPLIGTGLAAGCVAIFHRYARRAWFLRTRPNRSVPLAAHVSTPLPPDPAKEKAPDSGVRSSTRPEADAAPDVAASSHEVAISAEAPTALYALDAARQGLLAKETNVAVRVLASVPVSAPDPRVSVRTSASGAPGFSVPSPSLTPSVRASSRRASSSGTLLGLSSPSLGAPPADSMMPSMSPSMAPDSVAPSSMTPTSLEPPPPSLAPGPSIPPAETHSVYPDEGSSREAQERGRALRLLSESSSSTPPRSAIPAVQPSNNPDSGPDISVRPLVDSDARLLRIPDWSEPPARSVAPAGVSSPPSPAPVVIHEAVPEPVEPEAQPTASTANETPLPIPRAEPAWKFVLQSTGTADGW